VRLAFLTPLPPARTGVADYSVDVLGLLAPRHSIDVFHAQPSVETDRVPASCAVRPAAEFLPAHRERPYDLAVYQMGNGLDHAFVYEALARVPGLLVLHDLVLHHSRALMFLDSEAVRAYARDPSSAALRDAAQPALRTYRDEVAYTYPAQKGRLDAAHLATVGDLLPYAYPLFRLPVEASRLVAAHNGYMAEAIRSDVAGAEVVRVPMMVDQVSVAPGLAAALRARLGIAPDEFVVGTYGLLTREKQIETVARAVARASVTLPKLRLLLVGAVPDPAALDRLLARLGVRERTVVAGRVPFEEIPAHIEVADLAVHLRYPTARETSAALLRVLAQGRATVISDLEHQADIPAEAVVRADLTDEEGEVTRAILRLAPRPAARARIGDAARAFVSREHSPERCREAYEAAIERAHALPDPAPRAWPAHWLPARSERRH
jgi:glycosyltransferase involved in cell wall biosynthesis